MSARRRYFIFGSLTFALLVVFCVLAYNRRNYIVDTFTRFTHWITASPAPLVGSPAPDFELESLNGAKIKISSRRGIPVVINFWATWCAPCVLEMPGFEKTYTKYPGRFSLVAINAGETMFKVHQFTKDIGITFDVLLDPDGKVQQLYQIGGYPTTFILDSKGVIRVKQIGPLDEDQLAKYISQVGLDQ